MPVCKTVTVQGPDVSAPSASNFNVSTEVNGATVSITWSNPNGFSISFDSVITVDGSEKGRKTMSIGAGGTGSATYDLSFDIAAGSSKDAKICVDYDNVSA
jgi:carbohydrate-binding DOMON domain-containing protein